MLKTSLNTIALAGVLATPALASEPGLAMDWNGLPYAFNDAATKTARESSGVFCGALHGGLLVYDSTTNTVRRILDQHRFTNHEPNFFFNIDDRPVLKAGGIALSGSTETLYWTNLTGNHPYSLSTEILGDFATRETVIENAVKVAAVLPSNTDGRTADNAGTIYMTALSLDGIMTFDESTRQVSRFVHPPEMNWPDTLARGPDGAMYVVSNNLHIWFDGDMNFENPEIPNIRIWKIPGVGTSYTTE